MKRYTDGTNVYTVTIDNNNGYYGVIVSERNPFNNAFCVTYWDKHFKSESAAQRAITAYFVRHLGCIVTAM